MNLKTTLIAALLALPGAAISAENNAETWARAVDADVLKWRRDIHQFPELGNREFRTAKLVAAHLKSPVSYTHLRAHET
jgi:hypothetical protein